MIPVSEIESYVEDYAEESGNDQLSGDRAAEVTRSLVERRVTMELFNQVAAELDVTVSDAEYAEALNTARSAVNSMPPEQYQQIVQQDLITKDTLADSIRWLTLRDALVQELVGEEQPENQEQADQMQGEFNQQLSRAAERAGADVRINPRFGSWDPDSSSLNASDGALVDLSTTNQGEQELPPVSP